MLKKPEFIKKLAMLTDIHFGKRNNSRVHNQDCLNVIDWFCEQVRKDGSVTHIAFLGDWFESRAAINIETMDFSYQGLKKLDSLGIPIFFIVGNHDLHRRTTRDVHSVRMFNELKNFTVIDTPQVIDNILFSPYLFNHEYKDLIQYNDLWAFAGHFEFQHFYVTGYNTILEHGPDHKLFPGPKKIFAGHFHKRQSKDNVVYIGNTFPMDFGDSGDFARGMAIYEVLEDNLTFIDWEDCPKYLKVNLSDVMSGNWKPLKDMKVKCVIDIDLAYSEAQELRDAMVAAYDLRDFVLEEDREAKQGLLEGDNGSVVESDSGASIDDLVVTALAGMKEDKTLKNIDVNMLIELYKLLPTDAATDE
jgi:DNA repair exonuclease SbcCD nuclease subunit